MLSTMSVAVQERTERRLAAILTADLVGYSRLMGKDEEGTRAALKAIRGEITDPTIREHRGSIVNSTGDGLLAEFASVVDAVRCAVAMQSAMAQRNAAVPLDQRMEFRIGINLGDVIIDEGDIFGDGVNVAARLEPLAEPGGICVSQAVVDEVRGKLGFTFDDLGDRQVKNIARPVRIYRLPAANSSPALAVTDTSSKRPTIAYYFYAPFRNLFNVYSLAIAVSVAVAASVLPTPVAPFLGLWERIYRQPALQNDSKDKRSLSVAPVSQAPATPAGASGPAVATQATRSTQIGEPIFFDRGKVVLSEGARSTIDRQADFLRDNPKIAVTIEGHSSEDEGAREGRSVLAQLRANQVRNALRERGIADNRIRIVNYVETKPAVIGDSEASQAQNRSVIVLRN